MKRSRLKRVEEKRAKRQIATLITASTILLFILIFLGPRILVEISLLFSNRQDSNIISQEDTNPPFPPTIESLPNATNTNNITISGYGEPETILTFYINEQKVKETTIDTKGNFTLNTKLTKGKNTLYATSTDKAGNTSDASSIYKISYLSNPPKLEVIEPQDNETVSQESIEIKGITILGAQVTINDRFVSVDEDGTFKFSFKINEGENTIILVAIDQAGNIAEVTRTIIYTP